MLEDCSKKSSVLKMCVKLPSISKVGVAAWREEHHLMAAAQVLPRRWRVRSRFALVNGNFSVATS